VLRAGRKGSHASRAIAQAQGENVKEDVGGVRKESETSGENSRDNFRDEGEGGNDHGEEKLAPETRLPMIMMMPGLVAHAALFC